MTCTDKEQFESLVLIKQIDLAKRRLFSTAAAIPTFTSQIAAISAVSPGRQR